MDLGKHFILTIKGTELSKEEENILRDIKPSGIFIDRFNFDYELSYPDWAIKFKTLVKDAKKAIGRDQIFVSLDHEGGRVCRTPDPFTKAPYAEEYKDFTNIVGKIHAKELSSIGINVTFGPVCDINSNIENPVIGPRAFGKTPKEVIKASSSYIKELEKESIFCTLKHFPGHGDTKEDSHMSLPTVNLSKEELLKRELLPFKELIESHKIPFIMTAHVMFPAYDEKLPATLSNKILSKLLREKLNYNGLIVSDDMDMMGISDNFSEKDMVVNALNASIDLFLFNHKPQRAYDFIKEIKEALKSGEIKNETLLKSQSRIEELLSSVNSKEKDLLKESDFILHNERIRSHLREESKSIFSIEPVPEKKKAPLEEPNVRIGVVLEEDNKQEISFISPVDAIIKCRNGEAENIVADKEYTLCVKNNSFTLKDGNIEKHFPEMLIVSPIKKFEISSKSGILVKNIVAGRHFHWKKEIDQNLPGELEFLPVGNKIILVNTIPFELYVTCTVASEMSGGSNIEFAKAMATSARSWAWVFLSNKYPGKPYTLCNDDMSQRYQGTTYLEQNVIDAVTECRGDFLIADDYVAPAYYSKSTGGHGAMSEDIFGFSAHGLKPQFDCPKDTVPNLDLRKEEDFLKWLDIKDRKIFCSPEVVPEEDLHKYIGAVDVGGKYFRWEHTTDSKTIIRNLKEKYKINNAVTINELIPGKRDVSGRIIDLTLKYTDSNSTSHNFYVPNQFDIRALLHDSFLYSSGFTFTALKNDDNSIKGFNFKGAGWGHGVGFCQIGAVGMSLLGYSYKEILEHYFPEAKVVKSY